MGNPGVSLSFTSGQRLVICTKKTDQMRYTTKYHYAGTNGEGGSGVIISPDARSAQDAISRLLADGCRHLTITDSTGRELTIEQIVRAAMEETRRLSVSSRPLLMMG
jgi:hypothetical protein